MEKNNTKQLPSTWINTSLDCIVRQEKNSLKRGPFGSTIKKEFFVPSGFKVYEQKNVIYNDFKLGSYFIDKEKFLELRDFEVNSGDILVSCSGTIGRVAIVPENTQKGIINQALLKISLEPNLVNTKYFLYLLGSVQIQAKILRDARGSAMKNFASVKELKQIPFPIPPLNEQKRIVLKIEELFSKLEFSIQSYTKVLALLKNQYNSFFNDAFSGRLTSKWATEKKNKISNVMDYFQELKTLQEGLNKKSGKPIDLHVFSKTKIPNSWLWTYIGEISNVVRGGSPRPEGSPKYFGGNIPWITVKNLTENENMYLYSVTESLNEEGRKKSRFIQVDTLLLTNSGATLGVPKITKIGGCINDGIVAINSIDDPLRKFLYYYLKSLTKKLRLINQGAAQPNLNTTIVKSIPFAFPPKEEQQKIVLEIDAFLTKHQSLPNFIQDNLKRIKILKNSILQEAFSGKLIRQDPNDEPISELLKKIKVTVKN